MLIIQDKINHIHLCDWCQTDARCSLSWTDNKPYSLTYEFCSIKCRLLFVFKWGSLSKPYSTCEEECNIMNCEYRGDPYCTNGDCLAEK